MSISAIAHNSQIQHAAYHAPSGTEKPKNKTDTPVTRKQGVDSVTISKQAMELAAQAKKA